MNEFLRRLVRPDRWPAPAADAGLTALYLAAATTERLHQPLHSTSALFAAGVTAVLAGGLALRRRFPLSAFLASTAALCAEPLLHITSAVSPYADQVCVYSVGLYATRNRARWALPIVALGVLVYFAGAPGAGSGGAEPVGVLFVWIATWALGYSAARRREDQVRMRHALEQQVAADERTRIAREVHDVVGHTVNLMVVQAGAARLTLEKDPATSRDLLLGLERTGREALADLDQVLGTLRAHPAIAGQGLDPVGNDLRPTPGVAQLTHLAARLTDSGVSVSLIMDPSLRLPRNVDLSAYRIVQEALTNTMKYASPCDARVAISQEGRSVVVEVSDDGPGCPSPHIPGRGLLGIAERVSMYGGTLEYGRGERGGFTLRAALPLP